MAVTFSHQVSASIPDQSKPKRKRKSTRAAVVPLIPLDKPGRLRISNLQALLGLSHPTIYQRIAQGRLPEPDGWDLGADKPKGKRGRPYWYTSTIRPLLGPAK